MITQDDREMIADHMRDIAKDYRQYDPDCGIFSNDAAAEYMDCLASDVEGQELDRIRNESTDKGNMIHELQAENEQLRSALQKIITNHEAMVTFGERNTITWSIAMEAINSPAENNKAPFGA